MLTLSAFDLVQEVVVRVTTQKKLEERLHKLTKAVVVIQL